jgi:hypothetical protein
LVSGPAIKVIASMQSLLMLGSPIIAVWNVLHLVAFAMSHLKDNSVNAA